VRPVNDDAWSRGPEGSFLNTPSRSSTKPRSGRGALSDAVDKARRTPVRMARWAPTIHVDRQVGCKNVMLVDDGWVNPIEKKLRASKMAALKINPSTGGN